MIELHTINFSSPQIFWKIVNSIHALATYIPPITRYTHTQNQRIYTCNILLRSRYILCYADTKTITQAIHTCTCIIPPPLSHLLTHTRTHAHVHVHVPYSPIQGRGGKRHTPEEPSQSLSVSQTASRLELAGPHWVTTEADFQQERGPVARNPMWSGGKGCSPRTERWQGILEWNFGERWVGHFQRQSAERKRVELLAARPTDQASWYCKNES